MKSVKDVKEELIQLGYEDYNNDRVGHSQYMLVEDSLYFHLIWWLGFKVWKFSYDCNDGFCLHSGKVPLDVHDVASAILLYGNI